MFINGGERDGVVSLYVKYSGYTGYTGWEVAYRREQQLLEVLRREAELQRTIAEHKTHCHEFRVDLRRDQ